MKLNHFVKRGFAFGLALSMVISGSSIGNSTVTAAKKPKLSKSKLTITAGKTATLSVKNAKKKVKWSTSSKKVAKISAKSGKKSETATVKGVKKGKATITAKVGSAKLKCKVTVKKQKPNFKSVSVDTFDGSCLILKLKKKDSSLKVTDLSVTTKGRANGSYNKKNNVEKVIAVNKKQYRVYLQDSIDNGDYVQITSGVSKASTQYKLPMYAYDDEVNFLFKKGATVSKSFEYLEVFGGTIGEVKLSLAKKSKLPDGLTLDTKESLIKGIPTTVGNTTVNITGKDEMGRTAKVKVNIGIYDDTSISVENDSYDIKWDKTVKENAAAQAAANTTNFDADKTYLKEYSIAPKGGSGCYTFTLDTPDNTDVTLSTDKVSDDQAKTVTKVNASSTKLRIPYSITTGSHTYKVTVTDVMDASRTCTATITVNVIPYYNLTGIVKSNNGLPITGSYIALIPSKATSLSDAEWGYAASKSSGKLGTYDVEVPAGTYTVKVYGDVAYQMTKTIKVAKKDKIASIVVPERFYAVSANATYSNKGNKLENEIIYFESSNKQYESAAGEFSTTTNDEGSFNIALPANTYAAYMLDEKGNRKYFSKKITVTNKDLVISSMTASIARYSVEGIVFNGTSVDAQTQFADKITGKTLYFYNDKGLCVAEEEISDEGHYKVYLEGNATYVVKVSFGGAIRTLGSITVASDNQKDVNLTYTVATDIANATAYASSPLATESVLNSSGANDLVWSFTPVESGSYSFKVTTAVNAGASVGVFDSNMQVIRYTSNSSESDTKIEETTIGYVSLEANKTYYIKVLPTGVYSSYGYRPQAQGEVKLVITKNELTVVTPQPANTASPWTTAAPITTVAPVYTTDPATTVAPQTTVNPSVPDTVTGYVSCTDGVGNDVVEIPDTTWEDGYDLTASFFDCDYCAVYVLPSDADVADNDVDAWEDASIDYDFIYAGETTTLDIGSQSQDSVKLYVAFYDSDENGDNVIAQSGTLSYVLSPHIYE
jgi:hypothetical protein